MIADKIIYKGPNRIFFCDHELAEKMESYFETVPQAFKLRLPSGEILEDSAIIPNFCQEVLNLDPARIWEAAMGLGTFDVESVLDRGEGENPKWVPGEHKALNYRGRPVKRDKIWLQRSFEDGMFRYGYTGWQWKIANATQKVESVSEVDALVKAVNMKLKLEKSHNHWIITRYESDDDNIGFHSDKMKDWEDDSCFVVIKLGTPRRFEFSWKEPSIVEAEANLKTAEKLKLGVANARKRLKEVVRDRKYPEIFYSEFLSSGTAIIIGANANSRVRHGVPAVKEGEEKGVSGSIVGRSIKKLYSWDAVDKEIAKRAR